MCNWTQQQWDMAFVPKEMTLPAFEKCAMETGVKDMEFRGGFVLLLEIDKEEIVATDMVLELEWVMRFDPLRCRGRDPGCRGQIRCVA